MPSVLLLIADDWSRIAGCYGDPVVRTPHIDAVAARGTVFDLAFCGSPSCAVSRATILTGLHSHTHGQYGHCHGIHGFRTREDVQSLPRVLGPRGVHSACIGKKHVEPSSVYPFDVSDQEPLTSPGAQARAVSRFLGETRGAPFYLHVAPAYPHRMSAGFGLDAHREEFPDTRYDPDTVPVPLFLPDHPDVRKDLAEYYGAVSRYDHCVGQVLEALEASGRADETLVIILTDHGMPFPGAKASSFDSGHHCPLIVARPEQAKRGTRSQALVSWVDIFPTVLEWCGIEKSAWPGELQGRSLVPILEQEHPEGWDETYFSHCFHEVTNYFPYRVLRGRRYKYVRNLAYELSQPFPTDLFRSLSWAAVRREGIENLGRRSRQNVVHRAREELFDLEADPAESVNRVEDPGLANVLAAMRAKLMDFRIRTKDPWLEVSFQEGEPGAPGWG